MSSDQYHPFPNTHWSLVRRAGAAESQSRREAMSTLLVRYQPALRSYLRIVRRLGDEADEILQDFIADKLLEREMLRHADQGRGRFRTFLLTSLNNFVTSRQRAQGVRLLPLAQDTPNPSSDTPPGEIPGAPGKAREPSPDAAVEAAWARALVQDVLAAMRQKCLHDGREDIWLVFESRVLAEIFDDREPVPYETLAATLHLTSPSQAANLLVTAKRLYARLLRVAVSEYERHDADVDAEIAELRAILARAPFPSSDSP